MTRKRDWRFFTKVEAKDKVGMIVRSLEEFSGVPKGTVGTVSKTGQWRIAAPTREMAEAYSVAVRWDGHKPKPPEGWFTKDQYKRCLYEIGDPDRLA